MAREALPPDPTDAANTLEGSFSSPPSSPKRQLTRNCSGRSTSLASLGRMLAAEFLYRWTDQATMAEQVLRVNNSGASAISVHFEPWGDYVELLPTKTLRLVARSKVPGELRIDHEVDALVVLTWSGCTLRIFDDTTGEELHRGACSIPSP